MKETDNKENKPIVVLWDFSEQAHNAMLHAINFADHTGGTIHLLHIVKKAKEVAPAISKMEPIAEDAFTKYGIKPEVLVREGNIFTDISEIINDMGAKMAFMGTHGMKGMQKVLGSWALKVIANTKTPFIVVQQPPKNKAIKTVLFPIDVSADTKRKLLQAEILHKYYKPKFLICKPAEFSAEGIKNKIVSNFVFVKSYMNQSGFDFDIITVEDTKTAADATMKVAEAEQPDLILIITTKGISFQDYVIGAEEQRIIANPYLLPVMCMNPMEAKGWSFSSATAG